MADDPAQKKDKPTAEEAEGAGKGATEAKETTAKAKAAEKADAPAKPRKKAPARKPKAPKAEATAAEETGVGKEEAEAARAHADEVGGSQAPTGRKKAPAAKPRARDKAEAEAAKPDAPSPNGMVVVRANAKYVRTSARKARLVCDHIRGKSVEEAFAILAHTPRHVAEDWRKLLQSAVANAEHNHELLGDDLRIASVKADEGPTLKRFRPRAMGRATKIRKRTSHLTITLTPKD
jgi:ribosomal protein L22